MARFYGAVGYAYDEVTAPDVVTEHCTERFYKGDILRNQRRLEKAEGVNDGVNISNRISIVADPYALSHIFAMRYVKWMGVAWKVAEVEVETPRLILTLGGVYNGETQE